MDRTLSSTLAVIALCACSTADGPVGLSPGDGTNQSHEPSAARGVVSVLARPLSGRCTTAVTRLAPPPIEVQRIEYTCRISHLGLTHAVVTQTVDVTTGTLSSTGVFVAANGDQLNVTFAGHAVLSFVDPTDATVTFEGTQEFTPGTGRFADASGGAALAGSSRANLITGTAVGEFTLEGSLTY